MRPGWERSREKRPTSFASLFEDRRACSRRQAESQKIEMFEHPPDPGDPAFHFGAPKDSHCAREGQLQRLGVQSPKSLIQDQHCAWKLRPQRQDFLFPSTQIGHREHLV